MERARAQAWAQGGVGGARIPQRLTIAVVMILQLALPVAAASFDGAQSVTF